MGSPVLLAALEEKKPLCVDVLMVAWLVKLAVFSRVVPTHIKMEETQGSRGQE